MMIVPMNEKRGKLLLAEILNGGNFGQHFTKYGHFTQQAMAKKYFLMIWRNMHFVRYYPAVALANLQNMAFLLEAKSQRGITRILLLLKPYAGWFRLRSFADGVSEICRLNRRNQLLYLSVFYEEEEKK